MSPSRAAGGGIEPVCCWRQADVNIWQPTPVRLADCLVGASRTDLLGVDPGSGRILWRQKGYPMAAAVAGDGKLILLDEAGRLSLATATKEGFTLHAQCTLTRKYSYTVPTLVDRTLYVRDRNVIMAIDLGRP
jgi:hypothetical protein